MEMRLQKNIVILSLFKLSLSLGMLNATEKSFVDSVGQDQIAQKCAV